MQDRTAKPIIHRIYQVMITEIVMTTSKTMVCFYSINSENHVPMLTRNNNNNKKQLFTQKKRVMSFILLSLFFLLEITKIFLTQYF